MKSAAQLATRWLPLPHEWVAWVNVFLLLGLGLLADFAHLLLLSAAYEVDFWAEGSVAVLTYVCAAVALFQLWRRGCRDAKFRSRSERMSAIPAQWYSQIRTTVRKRPRMAIWAAAAAGVLVSCYPIIFCGKSFVTPDSVKVLLYNHSPTVPGYVGTGSQDNQRSDTGAMMWQDFPIAVIEHRAIFEDHELPIWNRYDAGGVTLIGQDLSMLGDPLHAGVIAAGGSAWAWDAKFLVARLFFAAGIGLCIRAATRRNSAALVLSFGACFLGFFVYRFNHPANFSLCYSPWVLLPWLWVVREEEQDVPLRSPRAWGWTALLLGASWVEFNSGTAKESVFLLLWLNAIGILAVMVARERSLAWKRRRLLQGAWVGVGLILLTTPFWRPFLEALGNSWSEYPRPLAWQLQPGLLVGLFDDIFLRQFNIQETVLDPSANFLVLLGIGFAAVSFRALVQRDRVFLALILGVLPLVAIVFGVVPSSWICAVPLLARVAHVDNVFACVVLVPLLVVAGFGLERLRERLSSRDFGWDYGCVAMIIFALIAGYLGLTQASQRSTFSPLASVGGTLALSGFCRGYVTVLVVASLAIPALLRWWRMAGAVAAWGVVPALFVCVGALLWRGGLQTETAVGWDRVVMHPAARGDARTTSPAVRHLVAASRRQPGLCMGFDYNLMGGFIATYRLEAPICIDALQNAYYRELLDHSPAPRNAMSFCITPAAAESPLLRLYDLLNVRYYGATVTPGLAEPPPIRGLRVLGHEDLDLYESPTAWPRAFFTDSILPCRCPADVYYALGTEGGQPFAAVAEEDLRAGPDRAGLTAMIHRPGEDTARTVVPAIAYHLTTRTTSFTIDAPSAGVAVLCEGYHSPYNEQMYLDGKPISHLRVNWAFTGIPVLRAGVHKVSVIYGPRDMTWLLSVSGFGLVLIAATAIWAVSGASHRNNAASWEPATVQISSENPFGGGLA